MGQCMSYNTAAVANAPDATATAKVILPDGSLREYGGAVRAWQVLRKEPAGGCFFLCCADDMDVEAWLPAVAAEEELEGGQIYFMLPRSMANRRLRAEEMAALAVRASAALARSGAKVALGGCRGKKGKGGGGTGRNFVPNLSAIQE